MKKIATADEVREYTLVTYILPARRRGEKIISFSSSDIHNGMGLKGRFPLVCSSIDANKFLDYANVIITKREGPKQSSTVRWYFDLKLITNAQVNFQITRLRQQTKGTRTALPC